MVHPKGAPPPRPSTRQLSMTSTVMLLLLPITTILLTGGTLPAEGLNARRNGDKLLPPLSPNSATTNETDGVLNPIYPLLMPSDEQDTATLTYNHDGKATVLQLVRSQGGSTTAGSGAGCEHYRTRFTTEHRPQDRTELVNCDGRIRGTIQRPDGTLVRIEFDATAGVHFIRRLKAPRRTSSVKRRSRRNHLSTLRGPYQANRHSKYVELMLVADNSLFRKLDSNEWKVHQYCADLVNHINMMYNPLNVFIALTHVEVWRDRDAIHVSQLATTTLDSFMAYRERTLLRKYPHDHAQLLSTIEYSGSVIGKARVSGMCSASGSAAIVRVHTDKVDVQASTMAHEMGHSFSMEHDEDGECACPDQRCIMTRSVTGLPLQHWSNCSRMQLANGFRHGLQHCLDNVPVRLAVASCGNGFVEPGEECDCGLEEACENHCCEAATCQLRVDAECATGECCDLATCRLREAATPCRGEAGECDLPEYCTGRSEYCPPDVHRRDTEVCAGGESYCVGGQCRTRSQQCRALWGPSGQPGSEACYRENAKGKKYGNCGYEDQPPDTFRKCAEEDLLCGVLFCHHHKEDGKLELGMNDFGMTHSVQKENATMRYLYCHSAYVDLGVGQRGQLAAFVPDGASCGEGRMCYKQRCESIEHLNARVLGGKHCSHDCYGRGVCNSKGHCHCDPGYDPPYCEHAGVGGSLDSGPASHGPGTLWHLITVAALLLLLCTVLLVMMVAYARRPKHDHGTACCTHGWRRPWRLYRVRGTISREPVATANNDHPLRRNGTLTRHDISAPKYHSSTRDLTDDQQFRPVVAVYPCRAAPMPPRNVPPPARVLPVPLRSVYRADPKLTLEYRIAPSAVPVRRPPAAIHRPHRPL